jgi:hypothetical protein
MKTSNVDTLALAKELVAELNEMYEDLIKLNENDNYGDYLQGCIDARGVIVGRLGYTELLNTSRWTDC